MVTLGDRLDFMLGKKGADKLFDNFGLRTVNDLLRHYPRKYSEGMSVRGEDDALDLEEGEHVTFVDVVTDTKDGSDAQPTRQACPQMAARHVGRTPAQGDRHVLQRRLDDRPTAHRYPDHAVG